MADREGFEPSVTLRLRILSRDVVSANSPICPKKNAILPYFLIFFLKNCIRVDKTEFMLHSQKYFYHKGKK